MPARFPWPLESALLSLTTSVPQLSEFATVMVLSAVVVWTRPARVAVTLVATVFGALLLTASLRWLGGRDVLLPVFTVLVGASVGAGVWLRSIDSERVRATEEARVNERLAISRELHDLVGHHLGGIALQAQAAQLLLPDDPARARDCVDQIEQSVREALASVRSVVSSLRTEAPERDPAPTIERIRALAHPGDSFRPAVVVTVAEGVTRLPEALVVAAHRICIEGVTNAQRHAIGATRIDVSVAFEPASGPSPLVIHVADDGTASSSSDGGGFGLVGLAERVREIGGTFDAGPRPGGGWLLRATLDVPAESPAPAR